MDLEKIRDEVVELTPPHNNLNEKMMGEVGSMMRGEASIEVFESEKRATTIRKVNFASVFTMLLLWADDRDINVVEAMEEYMEDLEATKEMREAAKNTSVHEFAKALDRSEDTSVKDNRGIY